MEAGMVNVRARPVFDKDTARPHIVFFATRDIYDGEELFVDYGDKYWRIMARELQLLHFK